MPFVRSSLQEITDRIVSDFQTRITGATSLLRRSTLRVIAKVMAGAVHLLYEYLDYQARQLFVTTADEAGLENHAYEYGLTRKSATAATGVCTATGTNGVSISAGTQLLSAAGQVYETDSAVTISGGVASLNFTASEAGEDGNDEAGISLTFVTPITGVNTSATVDSDGISGGADEETDDELRARILFRKRYPPHGGAAFDYEAWALEVSGVTRAWCFSEYSGSGTVGVAFVRDNDTATIIPNSAQRTTVRDYIVSHTDPATGITVGCPVTAEPGLTMIELTPLSVDLEISIYPNTSAVTNAVEDAIEDLIKTEGGPGETIYLSKISEIISLTPSEERHTIISPTTDITANTSQVHVLGTITFTNY